MTEAQLAWLAAMYEAEGWFTASRNGTSQRIAAGFASTDRDVIEAVRGYLDAMLPGQRNGKPTTIHSREPSGTSRKVLYLVYLRGTRAAVFMGLIRPRMFSRRCEQIDRTLASWNSRPTASESQTLRRKREKAS